ncbi:MAG TPA: CapA family protein [Bacilli bacterium]
MYTNRSDVHKGRKKNRRRIMGIYIALAIIAVIMVIGLFIWKAVDLQANQSAGNGVENSGTPADPDNTDMVVSPDSVTPKPVKTEPASPNPDKPDASGNAHVTLDFVGDIMLGSSVGVLLEQNGYDYPYSHVKPYFEKADYAIANLETAVTELEAAQEKQYVFKTSPEALPALKEAGIDLLNLANNHSMDYGLEGLFDTMKFLDEVGLNHMGAGKDAGEAYTPHIVDINGLKIAFFGFTGVVPDVSWKAGKNQPGLAETYNYTKPVKSILKAKEQADLVIVVAHWGIEREDIPNKMQTEMAHRYIDAGADLVVGSHAHVLQGFEFYKGKWIAYGLGNFIFTSNSFSATSQTAILEASCSKEQSCSLQVIPFIIKSAKPEPMDDSASQTLYKHLSDISINANLGSDGKVGVE